MTDPRAWLDQVDARTNAATDGPWEVVEEVRHFYDNPAHPEDECAWCESAVPLAPEEVERGHAVSEVIERSTTQPIGLPHDGKSYTDPTASACADRLERLRDAGYLVPQFAIDALREEDA